MSRFENVFRRGPIVIPFFVLGDPDPETSLRLILEGARAGAGALELGIPFTDPIADGPVVQAASDRALRAGMTPRKALELVRSIRRETDIPIGILTYANPVWRIGCGRFYGEAARSGADAVLVADLLLDGAGPFLAAARDAGVDPVFTAAPNTPPDRLRAVAEKGKGYLYLVSRYGVTGARDVIPEEALAFIRSAVSMVEIPCCVGFGISGPGHVRQVVEAGAAGAIVGSALIREVMKAASVEEKCSAIRTFIARITEGIHPQGEREGVRGRKEDRC
jgi:tryptophan synthase alpha chain